MRKYFLLMLCLLVCWCLNYGQANTKVNWDQLSTALDKVKLKDFFYKKGSLFNESEGVVEDYEMPAALFFSKNDSTNQDHAFVLMFQPIVPFRNDGIISESKAYSLQNHQCYYRETNVIQGLYIEFESHGMVACIGFRKSAMHDQAYIENLWKELDLVSLLDSAYK